MLSWSSRRKFLYLIGAVAVLALAAFYILYPSLKETPTCTDGKQNGLELGVDCGGTCSRICPLEVRPASILWSRAFSVTPGVFDVIGYIENQNADAGIPYLLYRFKLYDEKNVLIAERDGRSYLAPNQSFALFENQISTGERIPKRVFLEFEPGYEWVKTDARFAQISLSVSNKELMSASTTPRLSATVTNGSLADLRNVEVVAVVRDSDDNAIGVSQTFIDALPRQSSRNVFFTWLHPFGGDASRIEILPRVNPFEIDY